MVVINQQKYYTQVVIISFDRRDPNAVLKALSSTVSPVSYP